MKVRYENFHGEAIETTVADYVQWLINNAGGYGDGQIEDLKTQLNETRDILARLITVLEDTFDKEDVSYLCTGSKEPSTWSHFEVVEEEN